MSNTILKPKKGRRKASINVLTRETITASIHVSNFERKWWNYQVGPQYGFWAYMKKEYPGLSARVAEVLSPFAS